ncbi:pyruvate dehydrogenase E1 component beta subunit/2-oxoisovalerate dehydrogenase E1 component [Haladaptatus litoreus]|uniref:Pyruvate dehydrogenase E1 component beta subunit/2-oxoisovalerate dehydrogenase E1 component n=1 Tax=Haladaptatus litoreus TaxID=553468 RepID=A0A1N7E3S4_9EURY|nr:alpha-ketoacid dehydrogenase subunit beta [Haladaptatus litoreus]SIR82733.1 pyruvate dehydrogenase E1 component beta subunit/2-oxoisovalerate dehydrogenase E1 component [Haladaptatus litoreus]
MAERLRMIEAVRETLRSELERDDDVVVYGEDVGRAGGVFRATEGLVHDYPNRVFDAPVAEAGIVGVGVGLAATGMRPVPEIQFQSFLYQGFHQLAQHVARIRSRTRGTIACPMTIRTPYGGGIHALELHSESFEAGFAHVPGLKVVFPSSPAETKGLLTAAIRHPDPVIFMEPTRLYRSFREEVPDEHEIPLGEARVVDPGEDLTVIAWGSMLHETLDAVETVDADVEVVDPRTLYPLDTETIVDSVQKTGRCVVVHEAPMTAGMGAEIVARITEEAFFYLEAPMERVTGYDVPFPMFAREDDYLPDADRIAAGIRRTLDFG